MAAPGEFSERRRRIVADVEARKLDALVVSAAPNVRYLTGFTGSNGLLLVAASGAVLYTDPRYAIQAAGQVDCTVKVVRGPLFPALMQTAARRRLHRLGFEKGRLSYEAYELLRDKLPLGASLDPQKGLVERRRMVKSEEEIARIRRSVLTNSSAFEKTLRRVRTGVRESDLAAELDYQMRLAGADKPAFDTIVAAGARTALPHAQPGGNALGNNQLLLVDVGAAQDGYCSDMTRMAFSGRPGMRVRRLYQAVLEAQLAAIAAVRPGIPAERVDRAARRVLRAAALDDDFVHSTGHGLGLEIHEPPRLGKRDKTPLAPGMVITVEPGVYIQGFAGIRIEDTVLVTAAGCEVLTPTAKELRVL